jgi:DNA-binding transcriptional MerR regulator
VLRFIRHARDLAFPLEDIRRLLALWRDRSRASADVKRMAIAHVEALETKAAALSAMAGSLRHLANHCSGDDRPDCPILAELEGTPG